MTVRITKGLAVDGSSINESTSLTNNSTVKRTQSLPAAKIGALTTRTDDNTGVLTMNASHGITDAVKLDVYWAGGSRRNMTVGTVSVNSVPIDGGSGDNLPDDETAITAMIPVVTEVRFDGDDLKLLAMTAQAKATVLLSGDDDAEDYAFVILEANKLKFWQSGFGETNPVATDVITKAHMSHGDSSRAKTVTIIAAID
jgi:hypothetical protein